MKSIFTLTAVFLLFTTGIILAQENQNEFETIFKKKEGYKISHGGYGAFNIGYTTIDGKSAMQIGGRGAWVVNHNIALGLAGNGFFNNLEKANNPGEYYLAGGYGGFYFEPIVKPNSPIHISFPILIGGGGVSTIPYNYKNENYKDYTYNYDVFFVFEPAVEIEFNVVEFFRLSAGVSYRFTNGIILNYPFGQEISKDALNAFNFYLIFKFGKF
ncbi:MAG: hypothetical protein DRQ89_12075 [Epsilonproteobacteria bacterium]|nr:MAG: hypothetical protein DRQ89_12075 [Campylobacterota bacterium]